MNNKKRCKLKSGRRFKNFVRCFESNHTSSRLSQLIKYIKTGKYFTSTPHEAYELYPSEWVKDVFITSKIRRSRIKNSLVGIQFISGGE